MSSFKRSLSDKWRRQLPAGMDLELSSHPLTLKNVVNLVIAVDRLKDTEPVLSSDFRDEHLLDIMLDSIVEEQVMFEVDSAPPVPFQKDSEFQCSITDTQKKNLILLQNCMELHSVLLQGGNENHKVLLNMSTYIHPTPSTRGGRTVTLGIKGTNLYLSCEQEGDQPTLHLEEVEDKSVLSNIAPDSDMVRFLFRRKDSGRSVSTLMSVKYLDWYISTASEDHQPVELCQERVDRYRTFHIHRTI